jgi:hypothetical protein
VAKGFGVRKVLDEFGEVVVAKLRDAVREALQDQSPVDRRAVGPVAGRAGVGVDVEAPAVEVRGSEP